MGIYINPGNSGFTKILNSEYIDKTALISLVNSTIDTAQNLTCISRPRRFGKSFAAQMLAAYYDASCDSHLLFDDKEIATSPDYESHLNKYNVIYLDIAGFISEAMSRGLGVGEVTNMIVDALQSELLSMGLIKSKDRPLTENLISISEGPGGKKFVFIIDEWDAVIREAKHDLDAQRAYLNLLRGWFKNGSFTLKAVAAAYMTGILPIKKDGSQSALSDFREVSIIDPGEYSRFVGFTEKEVMKLCSKHKMSFSSMKDWYDGYTFRGVGSVYNPNSVMNAIRSKNYSSYWSQTSSAEALMEYISQDYNGMGKTIAELMAGIGVEVDVTGFANDLTSFNGVEDVLTLLIHLGYLAYDGETQTARIPNEEIRMEFQRSIRYVKHDETIKRLNESDKLFWDTINGDAKAVAAQIEKIHREETSPIHYNKEDSLRSVIKLAYYTYRDHYLQWEELPAGEGYADIVYLPKKRDDWPALLIELKWNESAETAIEQIKMKKYPEALRGYGGELVLVGISYDRDSKSGAKRHKCAIEKVYLSGDNARGNAGEKAGSKAGLKAGVKPGSNAGESYTFDEGSATGFVTESSRMNRYEIKTLVQMILEKDGGMSVNELASRIGYSRTTNTLREIVNDMVRAGEAEYLYPDKPTSRNQEIRLK